MQHLPCVTDLPSVVSVAQAGASYSGIRRSVLFPFIMSDSRTAFQKYQSSCRNERAAIRTVFPIDRVRRRPWRQVRWLEVVLSCGSRDGAV